MLDKSNDKNMVLFENLLVRIDEKLDFPGINPLNENSEKKKFFSKPGYNPVFRYAKTSPCDALLEKISRIELGKSCENESCEREECEPAVVKFLLEKLDNFRKLNAMMKHVGKEDFTVFSSELFGAPDEELVAKAYNLLKQPAVIEENSLTSKQVAEALQKSLFSLGFSDWRVRTKKIAANAAVFHSIKRIYVRKNSFFPAGFLKQMIVHEIGTHVFRSANGHSQNYKLFEIGLPDYLMTEEGLAVNMEEQNNCLSINTLRAYAGRVLAVHLSLNASFRSVYDELRKYFDENTAWQITLRAKRGLSDTSMPGAYTKDYLYLKGYYEVKVFLEKENQKSQGLKTCLGLKTLYYGRIGLQHVNLVRKISGLREPEFLPDSELFKNVIKQF